MADGKIVTFLKQLFCDHVCIVEKEEFLRNRTMLHRHIATGIVIRKETFNDYIIWKRCVKCDKQIIIEESRLV